MKKNKLNSKLNILKIYIINAILSLITLLSFDFIVNMHFQTIGNSLRIRFLAENAYFCDIFTGILCFNRYHRVSSGNNFTNNISTKVKARCLFNSGCCRASNNNFVLFFISSSPIISLI